MGLNPRGSAPKCPQCCSKNTTAPRTDFYQCNNCGHSWEDPYLSFSKKLQEGISGFAEKLAGKFGFH